MDDMKRDITTKNMNQIRLSANCYNKCQREARGPSDNTVMCVARGATPNQRTESMQSSNIKMGHAMWTKGPLIGNAHHRKNYQEYDET